MINARYNHQRMWLWILMLLLVSVLFFGLRPKDFRFENGAVWLKGEAGVQFNNDGLIFAQPFLKQVDIGASLEQGFSIGLSLKPAAYKRGNFGFILSIHDGRDRDQFLVGQWRSHIIVMNGDDYSHKRRHPRISVDTAHQNDKPLFLTLTTGKQGTRIYIDGHIAKSDPRLTLTLPTGPNSRMTLGNSVYGINAWKGEIQGLTVYGRDLTGDEVVSHFEQWAAAKSFRFAQARSPLLLYTFEEGQGTHVQDLSGNGAHLEIPQKMRVLQKRILSVPSRYNFELNRSLFSDVVVNLLGFMPLGLVLSVVLGGYKGQFDRSVIVLTVLICFLLSLGIEIAQAWIPSRSSSLQDLVLNTGGGWLGVVIGLKGRKHFE
ncbi:MAG: VanZ family protein [Nitrospinales bacterium]